MHGRVKRLGSCRRVPLYSLMLSYVIVTGIMRPSVPWPTSPHSERIYFHRSSRGDQPNVHLCVRHSPRGFAVRYLRRPRPGQVPVLRAVVVLRGRTSSVRPPPPRIYSPPVTLTTCPVCAICPLRPLAAMAAAGRSGTEGLAHRHQLVAFPALVEEQVHPADAFRPRVRPAHLAV